MEEEILVGYDAQEREVLRGPRREILKTMKLESMNNGEAPFAVRSVMLMLTNRERLLYVVKRGEKAENPGLHDKSVGGHVAAGEYFLDALRREANEELAVNVCEVNAIKYPRVVETTDLSTTAVVRLIDYQPWFPSVRTDQSGLIWNKRFQAAIYAGRYDGEVKFRDSEARALTMIRKPQLSELLEERPEEFADDLHTLLRRYHSFF